MRVNSTESIYNRIATKAVRTNGPSTANFSTALEKSTLAHYNLLQSSAQGTRPTPGPSHHLPSEKLKPQQNFNERPLDPLRPYRQASNIGNEESSGKHAANISK